MALSITVRLRDGRYDAAFPPDRVEWPPHPARLFCALVASADYDTGTTEPAGASADDVALRWLESAGPPLVLATPRSEVGQFVREGFVVSNKTKAPDKKNPFGGSTVWPGRTNGESLRRGALPADEHLAFIWPDAQADDATLWRLTRLTRRVPYLGRSTSSAEVLIHDEVVAHRPTWTAYRPTRIGTPRAIDLRVPYPGYLDQLRAAYDDGHRAWEVCRSIAYLADEDATTDEAADETAAAGAVGPYRDLLLWPIERGTVPISGDRLLAVTEMLRRAAISRIADPVPAQASGHGADGRPHVAFVPLLDAGHQHADGHLLGVGVAVPVELAGDDRLAILRGLLGADGEDPIRELRGGTAGLVRLGDPTDLPLTWGLRPDRWTGPPSGGHRWVSVTPVMLDRYPGRRDPAEVLADGFVTAGYPRPTSVTLLERPIVRGAVQMPRRGSLPDKRARRPILHCQVEFPTPVRGPVIAGALRYLGCGMFVPEVSRAGR
ncbi:hypothetical protein GCM10027280_20580 [Micromonospora polyrhachis]|uniref:CRISPR-associated protein Csb2 n=1 Tax=Micromonospora polyrhachis TaxID=1282883 RepID=A0A7W7WSK3_9ACTN|nr:type I-U CRISPR-associated protein Csb2 [Micromonospora polyrhachis]MBB4961727.1 CRISPR-associated protein Csb2 [Micromonospora polyrhachis]